MGSPAELTNNNAFPADFFNRNGLIYNVVGSGLRVTDNDFADINPTYADQFAKLEPPAAPLRRSGVRSPK